MADLFSHVWATLTVNANVKSVCAAVLAVWAVSKGLEFRRKLQSVNHISGYRPLFHPFSLPGAILPTTWFTVGPDFHWTQRAHNYQESETISVVPLISSKVALYTSNMDVARQTVVGQHKTSFYKPENVSQTLLLFGMNVLAADGDKWRLHRRILGPAFNSDLYRLVWDQTIKTYRAMLEGEGWKGLDSFDVPVLQTPIFKVALLIIGTCGFGFSFTWDEPMRGPDGTLSVQECIRTVCDDYLFKTILGTWLDRIPLARLQHTSQAFKTLTTFMQQQVQIRKSEIHDPSENQNTLKDNAFNCLVRANEAEATKVKLDDDELIGNVFGLLFAGHETTAHSLAASLGLLSINNDIQDEVYEQIISVVGHDRDPVFADYNNLGKVLGVFYEAIRLFPAGHVMIREATEDTVIQIPNPVGMEGTTPFPVPKGMQVVVDMIGVQYNPRYFDEPTKFKPSRWYDISSDSEAFTAFSVGSRGCIGRKFATTESVCFLTMLLREYRVMPLLKQGETERDWATRVLNGRMIVTLGVQDVPLRFVRRK